MRERTSCNCIDESMMGLVNIEFPKKVGCAPRKKKARGTPKVGLTGGTYVDWRALSDAIDPLTAQIDCIEGLRRNLKRILALHFVHSLFQLFILLESKDRARAKGSSRAPSP